MFISELINSMVNKASMLSVVSIPQKDKIEELYAPELSIPLVQLMAQFQTYSESMPVPTTNIEHANLNRFHRILESQAFSKYSKAHSALENPSSNSAEVLSNIRLASDVLLHEGKRLIGLRQTIFHLLKLAPKVIDDVFGKLPGSLAHIAGNIAQDRLNDEKEVVIYELDKTLFNILKLRAPKE